MGNELDRRKELREQAHAKISACKAKLRAIAASSGWNEAARPIAEDWTIDFQSDYGGPIVRVKFDTKGDYLGYPDGRICVTVECGSYGRSVTYPESKSLGNVNIDKIADRIRQNLAVLKQQQERADKDQERINQLEQTRRKLLRGAPLGVDLEHGTSGKFKLVLDNLSEKDVAAAFGSLASFTRGS